MASDDILKGKKILAVDDEPDILDTLVDILDQCDVETASSFDSAKALLNSKDYDAAILDIMGVRGFDLLGIAAKRKIPALMLTAHGLNPDNLVGSIKLGAKSYIPKDKIGELAVYLKDLFLAQARGIKTKSSGKNSMKLTRSQKMSLKSSCKCSRISTIFSRQ
jgi:DNA-binding response OmpR family regulator